MTLNPERWTLKTQEALAAAVERARDSSNAEVSPAHLLAAVLDQTDGIAGPILTRVGVEPAGRRLGIRLPVRVDRLRDFAARRRALLARSRHRQGTVKPGERSCAS